MSTVVATQAFMSTTLSKEVATNYATGAKDKPSTVIAAKMTMHFKGAVINWLSQYPDEVIIAQKESADCMSHVRAKCPCSPHTVLIRHVRRTRG